MGRAAFARDHGIDVDTYELDMDEFLQLTRDAYGGEVIRRVIEKLEDKNGNVQSMYGKYYLDKNARREVHAV